MNTALRGRRSAILVLEDDMLLAMDMEDHLTDLGFEVVGPFCRVSQALEAIPELDLVGAVVDLNLNGEFSFPVIDCLKRHNVPVVVCSGYAELPELRSKLGELPLLPKPWSPVGLEKLVSEVFSPMQAEAGE